MSSLWAVSPIVAAYTDYQEGAAMASRDPYAVYADYQLDGLGDDGLTPGRAFGIGMAGLAVVVVIVAGTSYVAGRAMAPAPSSKGSYGIGGAVLGTLLGPVGLGILGAVSLSQKR